MAARPPRGRTPSMHCRSPSTARIPVLRGVCDGLWACSSAHLRRTASWPTRRANLRHTAIRSPEAERTHQAERREKADAKRLELSVLTMAELHVCPSRRSSRSADERSDTSSCSNCSRRSLVVWLAQVESSCSASRVERSISAELSPNDSHSARRAVHCSQRRGGHPCRRARAVTSPIALARSTAWMTIRRRRLPQTGRAQTTRTATVVSARTSHHRHPLSPSPRPFRLSTVHPSQRRPSCRAQVVVCW
jgi:hypothetical protein